MRIEYDEPFYDKQQTQIKPKTMNYKILTKSFTLTIINTNTNDV
jgi:hypothetical protein